MDILLWDDIVKHAGAMVKNNLPPIFQQGSALTIGAFDGLHLGHRALFNKIFAEKKDFKKGAVSFVRPPKHSNRLSGDVSTIRLKLRKFQELGLDFLILIDFSESFAKIEGGLFFEILSETTCLKYLAVGEDFLCGYRRDTGVPELEGISKRLGFSFDSIERVRIDNYDVSSTLIRKTIYEANFSLTEKLLGYPFLLDFIGLPWVRLNDKELITSTKALTQIVPQCGKYAVRLFCLDGSGLDACCKITEENLSLSFKTAQEFLIEKDGLQKIDTIMFIDKE